MFKQRSCLPFSHHFCEWNGRRCAYRRCCSMFQVLKHHAIILLMVSRKFWGDLCVWHFLSRPLQHFVSLDMSFTWNLQLIGDKIFVATGHHAKRVNHIALQSTPPPLTCFAQNEAESGAWWYTLSCIVTPSNEHSLPHFELVDSKPGFLQRNVSCNWLGNSPHPSNTYT